MLCVPTALYSCWAKCEATYEPWGQAKPSFGPSWTTWPTGPPTRLGACHSMDATPRSQVQLQLDDVVSAQESLTAQLRAQDERAEGLWVQLQAQVHAQVQQVEQQVQQVREAQAQQLEARQRLQQQPQQQQQQQQDCQQQQAKPAPGACSPRGLARPLDYAAAWPEGLQQDGGHLTLKQQVGLWGRRVGEWRNGLWGRRSGGMEERAVGSQEWGLWGVNHGT